MAFKKLNKFFQKNINLSNQEKSEQKDTKTPTSFGKKDEETYENWGFEMARKQNGNKLAFVGIWSLVKEYFYKKEKNDIEKQESEINKANAELEKKQTEIEKKINHQ